MGNGDITFYISKYKRLSIFTHTFACCRIANVTDSHFTVKFCQYFVIKYIVDKSHILVMSNVTIVIYRDTAAFLSSVLKCIKSVIGRSCTITVRIINGEYTTFFTDSVVILHNLYPLLKYALY